MALTEQRRFDRIEVVFPAPTVEDPSPSAILQVRYIDAVVNGDDLSVVAIKGYHRETYDIQGELSDAPAQIQAAAAAMVAFQQAYPNTDAVV